MKRERWEKKVLSKSVTLCLILGSMVGVQTFQQKEAIAQPAPPPLELQVANVLTQGPQSAADNLIRQYLWLQLNTIALQHNLPQIAPGATSLTILDPTQASIFTSIDQMMKACQSLSSGSQLIETALVKLKAFELMFQELLAGHVQAYFQPNESPIDIDLKSFGQNPDREGTLFARRMVRLILESPVMVGFQVNAIRIVPLMHLDPRSHELEVEVVPLTTRVLNNETTLVLGLSMDTVTTLGNEQGTLSSDAEMMFRGKLANALYHLRYKPNLQFVRMFTFLVLSTQGEYLSRRSEVARGIFFDFFKHMAGTQWGYNKIFSDFSGQWNVSAPSKAAELLYTHLMPEELHLAKTEHTLLHVINAMRSAQADLLPAFETSSFLNTLRQVFPEANGGPKDAKLSGVNLTQLANHQESDLHRLLTIASGRWFDYWLKLFVADWEMDQIEKAPLDKKAERLAYYASRKTYKNGDSHVAPTVFAIFQGMIARFLSNSGGSHPLSHVSDAYIGLVTTRDQRVKNELHITASSPHNAESIAQMVMLQKEDWHAQLTEAATAFRNLVAPIITVEAVTCGTTQCLTRVMDAMAERLKGMATDPALQALVWQSFYRPNEGLLAVVTAPNGEVWGAEPLRRPELAERLATLSRMEVQYFLAMYAQLRANLILPDLVPSNASLAIEAGAFEAGANGERARKALAYLIEMRNMYAGKKGLPDGKSKEIPHAAGVHAHGADTKVHR